VIGSQCREASDAAQEGNRHEAVGFQAREVERYNSDISYRNRGQLRHSLPENSVNGANICAEMDETIFEAALI
jgi:hypothetical protein